MSASDLEKGVKWQAALSGELESSKFAVICLTPENLTAPWLLFEAGALSKQGESRTFTFLYGLGHSDVKSPLAQFNHTLATKEDTLKLIKSLNNSLGELRVADPVLNDTFQAFWQRLEDTLDRIPDPEEGPEPKIERSDKDLLKDILETVREQAVTLRALTQEQNPLTRAIERSIIGSTDPGSVPYQEYLRQSLINPQKAHQIEGPLTKFVRMLLAESPKTPEQGSS